MAKVHQGEMVITTKAINNRDAYYKKDGKPGKTKISLNVNAKFKAAADELGGNVWVEAKAEEGDAVLVPLAEGEWARA